MTRNGWRTRGDLFSEHGVFIRSVASGDHTATQNVLHYLRDGTAKFMLSFRRELFFLKVMLVLKALCPLSDAGIYEQIMAGREQDVTFSRRVQGMMRELHDGEDKLVTQLDALKSLGVSLRPKVGDHLPPSFTDIEVAEHVLK
jgi:DNA-directed RNA polymerase I subunit RPA2